MNVLQSEHFATILGIFQVLTASCLYIVPYVGSVYVPFFFKLGDSNAFRSATTIENSSAVQKPSTLKSGMILAARRMSSAFITKENSPSVMSVSGSVKRRMIGRINRLIAPSTTASTSAPTTVTVTPGSRYAAIKMVIVESIQFRMYIYV